MECSNNFCPLQLYMSSTTVSLTPGQCYTEFNEGALMSWCHSWHHIVNSYVAGEKKTGSTAFPCSLSLGNHGLFPKSFVSPTSNAFLIQVVIFHLWLSQRSHCGQNITNTLVKNLYAAYLSEFSSAVFITITTKPVLQKPSDRAYSWGQYVHTHYKPAGMKLFSKSIIVQALRILNILC